jgi:hypothetical protein
MAEGWGSTAANHALTTEAALYTWTKLYVGAPGASGTSNAATETTRKQVTWGTASSGSIASITNDEVWTSVAGSEDYTHFAQWTASSAGTFGWSGSVTANPVTAGDTFTIPAGSLTTSVTLAS